MKKTAVQKYLCCLQKYEKKMHIISHFNFAPEIAWEEALPPLGAPPCQQAVGAAG